VINEQQSLFTSVLDSLINQAKEIASEIDTMPIDDQVEALNQIRAVLHKVSPFKEQPIDFVRWHKPESVTPNDYNPNVMMRPEMQLLKQSITNSGMTQPVVCHQSDGDSYTVCDGEHRHITQIKNPAILNRQHGYIPITVTAAKTLEEKQAETIVHNRAKGVHKLDSMSSIVMSMLRAGWTDDKIAKELGMDADEILRMKQSAGIAKAYALPEYNRAWTVDNGESTIEMD